MNNEKRNNWIVSKLLGTAAHAEYYYGDEEGKILSGFVRERKKKIFRRRNMKAVDVNELNFLESFEDCERKSWDLRRKN